MKTSIWTQNNTLPTFPPLEQDICTDVLIIGGGLVGILCAHKLAQAGADYVLIEAKELCHGVTQNTTAKITSQHGLLYHKLLRRFGPDTARLYWEANQTAIRTFETLAQSIACDFERRDSYIYSSAFPDKLSLELSALSQLGIPAEFVSNPPLPFPTAGAIRFRDQAQFDPLKFAAGITEGLHIHEHTAALEFCGNTVVTDRGRITASKIIVATHFPILNKHGSYFLKMFQQRSYVVALRGGPDVKGMYLDEAEDGFSLRNHGDLLLLGGGGHRTGKKSAGWSPVEAFAKKHFPEASQVCRWAAQDCMTLDGIPYIGQYSQRTPNLFVATGFNKWGMTASMVAAQLLCMQVQGNSHPLSHVFDPSRSILHPQLLVNAAESAINLLMPTSPRCPHLGCALKWNPQEHSWDCPCHGSRFSDNGALLDGPATAPLKNKRTN